MIRSQKTVGEEVLIADSFQSIKLIGVQQIPNLITVLGILFSLTATTLLAFGASLTLCLFIILFAVIADVCDGYLARRLNIKTKVGTQLDTVNDILIYVAFVSAVLYKIFTPSVWIFLAIIIFVIASFARLIAFFKVGLQTVDNKLYYVGLPVYYNLFGLLIFLFFHGFILFPSLVPSGLLLISSGLMISRYLFLKTQMRVAAVSITLSFILIFFI